MRASMHVMACLVVLGLFTACGIDEYYTNIGTGAVPGQPLFKGNQEDKEPVFDASDTLQLCLAVVARMFPAITGFL